MGKYLSPVGRLVQGSPFKLNTQFEKDGRTPKKNKAGEDMKNCYIAVAFPKNDVDFNNRFYPAILAESRAAWPEYFNPDGSCKLPPGKFSYKVHDGDGVDEKGRQNNTKPGWAGCWVVKFSNGGYLPSVFHLNNYQPLQQVTDENALKLGYYVRVRAEIKTNRPSESPGVYLNFDLVEITAQCAPDQLIILGPDANEVFGSNPVAQLPPGAIVGAATPALPGPGGAIAPVSPAMAVPPRPVTAILSAPTYTMTAAAQGFTRQQYHDQNWTDEQLIAAGLMVQNAPQPASAPVVPSMPNGPALVAPAAPVLAPVTAPLSPSSPPQIAPNPNFVANALATPTYTMTAAAQGFTRQQYHDQNWTDEQLIAAGLMAKS